MLHVDISMIGDKELERALGRLDEAMQWKIVKAALRNCAKRLVPKIAAVTPVHTGRLRAAMAIAKVRVVSSKKDATRLGIAMPTREELAISEDAPGYYPYAIEYGTNDGRIAPRRFIRNTVDANQEAEYAAIGGDIGDAIKKEAAT